MTLQDTKLSSASPEVESRCLWAVLASPVSEAEAKAKFQAVAGRQPERVRFDRDWWFMGWLTPSEAKAWQGHVTLRWWKMAERRCPHRNFSMIESAHELIEHVVENGEYKFSDHSVGTEHYTVFVHCRDCGLSHRYSRNRVPGWVRRAGVPGIEE